MAGGAFKQAFWKKWERLIYAPLDLPAVPYFNVEEFKAWVIETGRIEDDKLKQGEFSLSRELYLERFETTVYPWQNSFLISPRTAQLANPWLNGFEQRFPQLAAYFAAFPLDDMVLSVLWKDKDGAVPFHRDRDGKLGFRVYLTPPVGSKLMFKADPSDPRTYHAVQPQRPHGWVFNNVFYHSVDKVERSENRIVVVVQGVKRFAQVDAMLDRSIAKFSQYALWDERAQERA